MTAFGKAVRAIGDDEEVSKVVGINTTVIIAAVFFIGAMFAAMAGLLSGHDTAIQPRMGLLLLLKGWIASVVGGMGNLYGAIVGGFAFGDNRAVRHLGPGRRVEGCYILHRPDSVPVVLAYGPDSQKVGTERVGDKLLPTGLRQWVACVIPAKPAGRPRPNPLPLREGTCHSLSEEETVC